LVQQGFFDRDPRAVAPELLGMLLISDKDGVVTGGRIVETEAYLGSDDPGSHAATKGITKRNATMYGPPGHLYVYFTYGNHHMLNLVCESEGTAGAVLIRAIEPTIGLETMRLRRQGRSDRELTNGPGKLAAALGLTMSDNGGGLIDSAIRIHALRLPAGERVATSGRIGLSAGHELHLRYYLEGHKNVSKGRIG
jgi:DNA-3-methyladenine glycosylase